MSERVLPGVSIREVTEGLTGIPVPGAVAAKLVGTACKGPATPQYFGPGEVSKFREMYGPADPYHYSVSTSTNPPMELTLRRAGDLLFSAAPPGGVWVCRAAESDVEAAIGNAITFETAGNLIFTAKQFGGWFNNITYRHYEDLNAQGVTETGTNYLEVSLPSYDFFDSSIATSATTSRPSVNQFSGSIYTFEYIAVTGSTALPSDFVSQWTGTGNAILSALFTVSSTGTGSSFTTGSFTTSWTNMLTSADTGGTNWSSTDTAVCTTGALSSALENLRSKEARLTIIAGASENTNFPSGALAMGLAHVVNASRENIEQMYICGVDNYASQDTMVTNIITASALALASSRAIKVAPGLIGGNPYQAKGSSWDPVEISTDTEVTLSGGYAAALAAGVIAQQVPDQSPMNKPLAIGGLEFDFTLSNKKTLVRDDFFLLVNNNGYKTLRDITTVGEGDPFFHVSTRMALDDIKRAIRLAGGPFIGLKNNPRILSIMKRNLEEVLKNYVKREIITPTWSLSVESARLQQILGVVDVTMVIQLVFYIEFIEVVLVLE